VFVLRQRPWESPVMTDEPADASVNNDDTADADAEFENGLRAGQDILKTGSTDRRCLRCGGAFTGTVDENRVDLQCATPDCYVESVIFF
jgi:hypothetical protein